MMPQEETYEQTGSTYGRYGGDQVYDEAPYEPGMSEIPVAKVYQESHHNQNVLRLIGLAITMISLLAFAVICLVLVGGIGGLISFCAACVATPFIVAYAAINKIK